MSASEDQIQQFIEVTGSSRRTAIWFVSRNRRLEAAIDQYFNFGESSIPSDFDPESRDATQVIAEGGGEPPTTSDSPSPSDDSHSIPRRPTFLSRVSPTRQEAPRIEISRGSGLRPREEIVHPRPSPFGERRPNPFGGPRPTPSHLTSIFSRRSSETVHLVSSQSQQKQAEETVAKETEEETEQKPKRTTKLWSETDSSILDEEAISVKKNNISTSSGPVFLHDKNNQNSKPIEHDETEVEVTPYPARENEYESVIFVVWDNGFSVGNEFHEKTGSEYDKIMAGLMVGKIPETIKHVDDFQLVDRRGMTYDKGELDSILASN